MKTIKFLMVLVAISFFTIDNGVAQPASNDNKTTSIVTSNYIGLAFCGSEQVKGTMTVEMTQWDKLRYQKKTTFILEGQVSHAQYIGFGIINFHRNDMPELGWNRTYTQTFSVTKDGVPVGYSHVNYHDTYNPDGVWTSQAMNVQFECF